MAASLTWERAREHRSKVAGQDGSCEGKSGVAIHVNNVSPHAPEARKDVWQAPRHATANTQDNEVRTKGIEPPDHNRQKSDPTVLRNIFARLISHSKILTVMPTVTMAAEPKLPMVQQSMFLVSDTSAAVM